MTGSLISFEGIDRSGKSTQALRLARGLRALGRQVVETHEPGGTDVGSRIRDVLLDRRRPVGGTAEIFLFAADRAHHVEHLIRPALAAGRDVVCDRFSDSSVAYQGYGRQTDVEQLLSIQRLATGGLCPRLTVLVDVDLATAAARGLGQDRIERAGSAFYLRVRDGFRALAEGEPARFLVVDGRRPELELAEEILEVAVDRLGLGRAPGPAREA